MCRYRAAANGLSSRKPVYISPTRAHRRSRRCRSPHIAATGGHPIYARISRTALCICVCTLNNENQRTCSPRDSPGMYVSRGGHLRALNDGEDTRKAVSTERSHRRRSSQRECREQRESTDAGGSMRDTRWNILALGLGLFDGTDNGMQESLHGENLTL